MTLSGNPADYLFVFLGGVALSFTPCVYPLIPVILGYIGAKGGSGLRGFTLSLAYVSGIAFTYSFLGLFASLTGKLFGSISSHPLTHILVGAVIIIFGISMLGLIRAPFVINPRATKEPLKQKNYLSIFLLGVTSGLVISPCLSPVLGSILSYLATKNNIPYGMSLLASFAYGMGLVLILSGTFAGFLAGLPKSGRWMVYFQRLAAIILLFMGAYFLYNGIERIR